MNKFLFFPHIVSSDYFFSTLDYARLHDTPRLWSPMEQNDRQSWRKDCFCWLKKKKKKLGIFSKRRTKEFCKWHFRQSLAGLIKLLIRQFREIERHMYVYRIFERNEKFVWRWARNFFESWYILNFWLFYPKKSLMIFQRWSYYIILTFFLLRRTLVLKLSTNFLLCKFTKFLEFVPKEINYKWKDFLSWAS